MVRQEKLAGVLSEFARTLATDFPIQGILDHLVERIVEVLPVTAAGVTLISAGTAPRYVAASDESALLFERLQTVIGQGPCLMAYASGQAVAIPDLGADDRFPQFTPRALAAGLSAVFTFPLVHGDGRLGALDLYRDTPGKLGKLGKLDMDAAQTLADVTTAYLLNAQAREDARATSEQFRQSALHDALTGLPNRLLLQQRITHAAQRARRSHACAAILFADLDLFKKVNDTYGHQVGDELLIAVAQRLSSLVRPGDTLARVSGDEFVFLCEDLQNPGDAQAVVARIDEAFGSPFVLAETELRVTASVGTAFAGPGQDVFGQLLDDAGRAMYESKRKGGGGLQDFQLRPARPTTQRSSLDSELRSALANDRLDLAYQPIVRSSDQLVIGVEALLRWNRPGQGPVPPLLIVAVTEHSGLIGDIGKWVLERGCRDRESWLRDRPGLSMDLAVNVSGRQLMSVDFRAEVQSVLDRTGMDPDGLILEITENIFVADSERAVRALGELRALGIRIALDDFGTGYSSLSSLRRLPIDIVKIDRSFVADIGHALSGRAIVGAATDMVHALGLTVTAEGVEDQTQQIEVTALGCDNAQGFFYARPMPAPAIAARLAEVPADCWRLPAVQGVHSPTRSEPRVLTLPGSGPSANGPRRGTEHREGALER